MERCPAAAQIERRVMNMAAIWRIPGKMLRKDYPIVGSVEDWYFRVTQISPGLWRAEGSDVYGRLVKAEGPDRDAVLAQCDRDARSMPSIIVP